MTTPESSAQPGPADAAMGAAPQMPLLPAVPPAPPKRRVQLRWWHLVLTAILSPILLIGGASLLLPMLFGGMGQPGGMFGEQQVPVVRMDLAESVTLSGTIQPTQRLDLSFAAEGEVTSVRVAVGDSVSPGTALASIDNSRLRDAVTDAKAENDAAWKDYQDARKSGPAATVTALRSAHNVKAQALKDAEAALEKATLVSTIDGVVAAVNVQIGDLAGSTGGTPGDPGSSAQAAVVVISRTFQVDATVGAADRGRVAKGMAATVTTSSSPNPLPGTVSAVGVVAQASDSPDPNRPSAASFKVTITLDGQPDTVFTGAAASVSVNAEGKTGVLAIPVVALLDRPSDTDATVLVQRGEEAMPTEIKVGTTAGDMIEVTSGLEEGDLVVIPFGMGSEPGGIPGPGTPAGPRGGGVVEGAEPPR